LANLLIPAEIARRIARDERQVITPGVVAAKRASIMLREKVLTSYRYGRPFKARDIFIDQLRDKLVSSMVIMHVKGEQLSDDLRARAKFAAEDTLKTLLEKLTDGRRRNALARRYNADAIKILNAQGAKIESKLRKTINELIVDRTPLEEGIGKLGQAFNDLGLTAKNDFALETIFRTQSQIAYNAGRWQADQDPDIQSILWGYEYTTVGDNRVRPEHAALNGVKLPKDDPFWKQFWPPNGYNCRCAVIPIFEETQIVRAPKFVPGTETIIQPDAGFNFNAGLVLAV